uniref:Uncharacterized protein n=1 Tax=Oryza nivara TaxID=4536 RepID=A0A0E0H2I0_ORYNI
MTYDFTSAGGTCKRRNKRNKREAFLRSRGAGALRRQRRGRFPQPRAAHPSATSASPSTSHRAITAAVT